MSTCTGTHKNKFIGNVMAETGSQLIYEDYLLIINDFQEMFVLLTFCVPFLPRRL